MDRATELLSFAYFLSIYYTFFIRSTLESKFQKTLWLKILEQALANYPQQTRSQDFIPFVDKYKSTSLRQTTPGKANNLPLEIEFYLLSLPYSRSLSLKPTANKRIKRKLERLWLKLIVGSEVASRPTRARGFLSRTSLLKKLFTDPGKLSPSPPLIPVARFSPDGFIRGKQISRTWHRSDCETESSAVLLYRQ